VLRVGAMVVFVVVPGVVESMHHEPQPLDESRTHDPLQHPSHGMVGNPVAPAHRAFSGVHVAPGGVVAVTTPTPSAGAIAPVPDESMHHDPQPLEVATTQFPLQQPPSHGTAGKPGAPMQRSFRGVQVCPFADEVASSRRMATTARPLCAPFR
jgi:hypothetical protein